MVENGKYKLGVEHRLTKVEESVQGLSDKLTTITDNHLAHLAADIKEIKEGQTWVYRTVIGATIGFVFSMVLLYFK